MTVQRCNCDWMKQMMIYSDNMIVWQHTWNISSNPNDTRLHRRSSHLALSARRRHIIDPGRFLTCGIPAERRGYRMAVLV